MDSLWLRKGGRKHGSTNTTLKYEIDGHQFRTVQCVCDYLGVGRNTVYKSLGRNDGQIKRINIKILAEDTQWPRLSNSKAGTLTSLKSVKKTQSSASRQQ